MAKIRIARDLIERQFWPGEDCRVRIVGAAYDAKTQDVVLEVRGEIADGEYRPMVTRRQTTEFRKA